jgi:oligopeptide/dipeptide ABC transporter ATP-binding protein
MENVLEVKNLVTEFKTSKGTVRAVDDISFNVKKGKVLGIVGESGSGKSVTSLSVMGLLPKTTGKIHSGEVNFNGVDLTKLKESEIRKIRGNKIAMIFQEPMTALNPVFTIGWQIGEVLEIHQNLRGSKKREAIIDMLRLVKIPNPEKVINDYPNELSGGMRQRIMIAIALCCKPELLIADEPTTALDVTIQAQILELMKELREELSTSIMLITHDLGVIAEMADDVVVMYKGKVLEECSVEELFKNPQHPYTKGLMQSRPENFIKGEKLFFIPGMALSAFDNVTGCAFASRCQHCMDICKEDMPKLDEIVSGHKVRCWLYKAGDNNE